MTKPKDNHNHVQKLAGYIGDLRRPNPAQPAEDTELAHSWLQALYAAHKAKKRETQILNDMAAETARMTAQHLGVKKTEAQNWDGVEYFADNMDFYYTQQWMREFEPKKHWWSS